MDWVRSGRKWNGESNGDRRSLCLVGGGFTSIAGLTVSGLARLDTSTNTWSSLLGGITGADGAPLSVASIVVNGGSLYVGGSFSTIGGVTASGIARWDLNAQTWQAMADGINNTIKIVVADDGKVFAGGSYPGLAVWNGSEWSSLGDFDSNASSLLLSGNLLYVTGYFSSIGSLSANSVAVWNITTSTWSALGAGLTAGGVPNTNASAQVGNDIYFAGSFLAAGEINTRGIAKWNTVSNTWAALGTGVVGGGGGFAVQSLMVSNGKVFVSGGYTTAGGLSSNSIASWDGSNWAPIGLGLDGPSAVVVEGAAGEIYYGGTFAHAGGLAATGIAKWNGSAWSILGTGLNGSVTAIALDSSTGDLYVGGKFTTAGGVSASRIAKWNGTTWSALGLGITGGATSYQEISAIFVDGSKVYVGGCFTTAGSITASNLAIWDKNAQSWSSMGWNGYPDTATTSTFVKTAASDIIVAINSNGTAGIAEIIKWNGTTLSEIGHVILNGASSTSYLHALKISGNTLYLGGLFDTFYLASGGAGVEANNIGQYNVTGNTFSTLGGASGTNGTVYALEFDASGKLWVGGTFTSSNGLATNNIAAWDGSSWSKPGNGVSADGVYGITFNNDGMFLAGSIYGEETFTMSNFFSFSGMAFWPF